HGPLMNLLRTIRLDLFRCDDDRVATEVSIAVEPHPSSRRKIDGEDADARIVRKIVAHAIEMSARGFDAQRLFVDAMKIAADERCGDLISTDRRDDDERSRLEKHHRGARNRAAA